MAIVQISRITHRKGLHQDLPQLASAEIGWSIDTRQLYIGNGTIAEGAPTEGVTEILTQYTDLLNVADQYIFKGAESGYTSQTGPTSLLPVTRTLQQKLDDVINVRDFGAVGNGIADDTVAIQRAIDEVLFGGFSATQTRLRRPIHFPAGIFIISASLKIPSYLTIIGAGINKTTIQQTVNSTPVMQLKDSSSQIDAAYGTLGATLVSRVNISDITLENVGNRSVVKLDSCSEINFTRVQFKGAQTNPNSSYASAVLASAAQHGVYAIPTDPSRIISGVNFIDCAFTNCHYGAILNSSNVKFIGCDFTQLSRAIYVDTTFSAATTRNIKVSNSSFDAIAREAIYVNTTLVTESTAVISMGNFFADVGTAYVGAGGTSYPVIRFSGSGNYSVTDAFTRSEADAAVYPRVLHVDDTLNVSLSANVGLQTGMVTRGTGRTFTIAASQTDANTGILLKGSTSGSATIEYILERPSVSAYRHGTLDVIFTGTTVQYVDEYVETPNAINFTYPGPTGVTLSVTNISSGLFKVNYTSDGSGAGTLTYSVTKFQI